MNQYVARVIGNETGEIRQLPTFLELSKIAARAKVIATRLSQCDSDIYFEVEVYTNNIQIHRHRFNSYPELALYFKKQIKSAQ